MIQKSGGIVKPTKKEKITSRQSYQIDIFLLSVGREAAVAEWYSLVGM